METLIIILWLSSGIYCYDCVNPYKTICCKSDCPYCGSCQIKNDSISFDDFENNCCYEMIIKNNNTCNDTMGEPPCTIVDGDMNDINRIIKFFNYGPLWAIILTSVLLFGLLLFLLYVCCVFGKKKPPVKYKLIKEPLYEEY